MASDSVEIMPATAIRGAVGVPGDKSISHRLALLGAIAEGTTTIENFAESADCKSTLDCLQGLGVSIQHSNSNVTITGRGLRGLDRPTRDLDAGNSGTTVRLISGILAGHSFESTLVGDASLSRRPMKRIIEPLTRLGAAFSAREGNFLPMKISGGPLTAIDYELPVASAQVKSAVLLAGALANGSTRVHETVPARNHTEIALREFGSHIQRDNGVIRIEGGVALRGGTFVVPGDLSSAAFLVAAAAGLRESNLRLTDIGVNDSRSGFLQLLEKMGARLRIENRKIIRGEPVADLVVETSVLTGMEVGGAWIPNIIDEIPILAVLATRTRDGIRIRDAGELRTKESDRIRAIATNLRALGTQVEEYPDGLFVPGNQVVEGGRVDSFDDHRIAMAFAVGGLFARKPVTIKNPACVGISFPRFFETLLGIVH